MCASSIRKKRLRYEENLIEEEDNNNNNNLSDNEDNNEYHKRICYWDNNNNNNNHEDNIELNFEEKKDNHKNNNNHSNDNNNDNNDNDDDDMEIGSLQKINEIKLNGITLDGIYPKKPKFGRRIDHLIDDVIRKSQRHSTNQNCYALTIPSSDSSIWIPSTIGPHPSTDSRYIHKLERNREIKTNNTSINISNSKNSLDFSDNTTHSEWFCFDNLPNNSHNSSSNNNNNNSHINVNEIRNHQRQVGYDDSSSSDECEDMNIIL